MGKKGEVPAVVATLTGRSAGCSGGEDHDYEIRQRGLDPSRVRRWFQKHHHMTFQAYQRALRIGQAFGRIRHGDKVIDAAFDSGYESLSGFSESFKKITGVSPKKNRQVQLIRITRLSTPLGPMLAGATEQGIACWNLSTGACGNAVETPEKTAECRVCPRFKPFFDTLQTQLDEYFAVQGRFSIFLGCTGNSFQQRSGKPYVKYPTVRCAHPGPAQMLGKRMPPCRGQDYGDNRIAILIPCHRVIGKDGKLVGYGGGLSRKRYLLDLENRHIGAKLV